MTSIHFSPSSWGSFHLTKSSKLSQAERSDKDASYLASNLRSKMSKEERQRVDNYQTSLSHYRNRIATMGAKSMSADEIRGYREAARNLSNYCRSLTSPGYHASALSPIQDQLYTAEDVLMSSPSPDYKPSQYPIMAGYADLSTLEKNQWSQQVKAALPPSRPTYASHSRTSSSQSSSSSSSSRSSRRVRFASPLLEPSPLLPAQPLPQYSGRRRPQRASLGPHTTPMPPAPVMAAYDLPPIELSAAQSVYPDWYTPSPLPQSTGDLPPLDYPPIRQRRHSDAYTAYS